jgi:peptidylprolyl isomerase
VWIERHLTPWAAGAAAAAFILGCAAAGAGPSAQEVLSRSVASDWRPLDPRHTLYLELAGGRVVIELAPWFAPRHVANIEALARQHYFDGLAVLRVQDDYVVQWGDADETRDFGPAAQSLAPEFERRYGAREPYRSLPDGDVYAPRVGFIDSWPVARDPKSHREWLTHCYGMLGVARATAPGSGSGAELYVVIGQAPRQLDRNVTLAGRVVAGIERLSSLPRGSGELGFYQQPEERVPIESIRIAAEVPVDERSELEVLRSDAPIFRNYVAALRSRTGDWFVQPTDHISICNVRIPVRPMPRGAAASPAAAPAPVN